MEKGVPLVFPPNLPHLIIQLIKSKQAFSLRAFVGNKRITDLEVVMERLHPSIPGTQHRLNHEYDLNGELRRCHALVAKQVGLEPNKDIVGDCKFDKLIWLYYSSCSSCRGSPRKH